MSNFIATKYLPKKINVIEIKKGPVGLGHNSRATISTQTLHNIAVKYSSLLSILLMDVILYDSNFLWNIVRSK